MTFKLFCKYRLGAQVSFRIMIANRFASRLFFSKKVRLKYRHYSTIKPTDDIIRNIAILAHIDAGDFQLAASVSLFVIQVYSIINY